MTLILTVFQAMSETIDAWHETQMHRVEQSGAMKKMSDQLDVDTVTLKVLEDQVAALKESITSLKAKLASTVKGAVGRGWLERDKYSNGAEEILHQAVLLDMLY